MNKKDKYLQFYFSANQSDHTLTQIHFLVHSILIATITILLSTAKCKQSFWLVAILSLGGILASIITSAALKRSESFKLFWKSKVDYYFIKEMDENLKPKCWIARCSRKLMIWVFFSVYIIFIIYSILVSKIL